jgi:hypothetical protein
MSKIHYNGGPWGEGECSGCRDHQINVKRLDKLHNEKSITDEDYKRKYALLLYSWRMHTEEQNSSRK